MELGLSDSLRSLVSKSFRAAKQSQSLLFSETELAVIRSRHGVPVSSVAHDRHPFSKRV